MIDPHILFWSLLIIVSAIFYIKDNLEELKYKQKDRALIKKAKQHKKIHRRNILNKRKKRKK